MKRRTPYRQYRWAARSAVVLLTLVLLAVGVVWWRGSFGITHSATSDDQATRLLSDLPALIALPTEALQELDIGRMNLLCAEGLPGSEKFNLDRSLATLDEMAARVQAETKRHYYRFQRNPVEFEHSEGFYRMLMLAVVLAEDFQVQYAPNKIGSAADAWTGDGFFADSRDVFLHGLTGPKPRGTCSSLPVLQVAVGWTKWIERKSSRFSWRTINVRAFFRRTFKLRMQLHVYWCVVMRKWTGEQQVRPSPCSFFAAS